MTGLTSIRSRVLIISFLCLVALVRGGSNCAGGLSVSCGPYACCPTGSSCYYSTATNNTACCQSGFNNFCGLDKCCTGQCGPTTQGSCIFAISVCSNPPGNVCGNLGFCCQPGSYCNGSWNYNAPIIAAGTVFCYNASTTPTTSSPISASPIQQQQQPSVTQSPSRPTGVTSTTLSPTSSATLIFPSLIDCVNLLFLFIALVA